MLSWQVLHMFIWAHLEYFTRLSSLLMFSITSSSLADMDEAESWIAAVWTGIASSRTSPNDSESDILSNSASVK